MTKTTKMIKKAAEAARKAVLLGMMAAMGSLAAYASETAEKAGPAIERAKMETVKMDVASVEAKVLAETATKLSVDFSSTKCQIILSSTQPTAKEVAKQDAIAHEIKISNDWFYNSSSDDPEEITKASNWDQMDDESGCGGFSDRPCHLSVNAMDRNALQTILDGYVGNETQLLNDAGRRP